VGITDDVTFTSLPFGPEINTLHSPLGFDVRPGLCNVFLLCRHMAGVAAAAAGGHHGCFLL
jgi:hypothetical protein